MLVEGAAPGVAFAAGVVLLSAVFGAGAAQGGEAGGVAAGFREEVAAVAEHVSPSAEPSFAVGGGLLEGLPGAGGLGQAGAVAGERGPLGTDVDGVPGSNPPRGVEGTELAQPEDTTRENILAEAGYEQVYDIDEIITRMPAPAEVERLNISTGTPVAEHIRTGYTADNMPVRVMISIIPGDTLILQYNDSHLNG
jgi:hypothetical protein